VDILTWLIVGLIAGLLASSVAGGIGYGLLGDILVAFIGAVVFLLLVRLLRGRGRLA